MLSHHLIEKGKINIFESMRNFYGTDNCVTNFFHFNEFKTPTDVIQPITEVPNDHVKPCETASQFPNS